MQNHKQIPMKSPNSFKEGGPCVLEPGMWWNLDIFGKFAFEIRMDYWYLWKTHFLNFRDLQESPNPLKILYKDHCPSQCANNCAKTAITASTR